MIRALITIACCVLLLSCSKEPERWTAFVYPPGKSLAAEDAHKAIHGKYSTFEDCQSAAISALRIHQDLTRADDSGHYECGVGCRYESEYDLYICKETRK